MMNTECLDNKGCLWPSPPAPNNLRVLLVLRTLWGENGITSHLMTLAKGLIGQGFEVGLVTSLATGVEGATDESLRALERFEHQGIRCFIIPFPDLKPSVPTLLKAGWSLLKLNQVIRRFKPDVIHVHSLTVCPYTWILRQLYRIPYVSTCHLQPSPHRSDIKVSQFLSRYLKNFHGDRVIAISSELRHAFEQLLQIPQTDIRLIYHGVDDQYFRSPTLEERRKARESFGLEPEAKVVCHIGRLAPEKGHDVLIQAIALLKAQGIQVIALCAGRGYGVGEETVRNQAVAAGVMDQIQLLGMTDARQVLWAADVLVLPSKPQSEAFPLVIPEAMLCGVVPIRTPSAGAVDQIEDGINGFIMPFDDAESLALRLTQLFTNSELQTQMSGKATATAQEKFILDQMIKKTVGVYQELCTLSVNTNFF